jgi:hypothetical protein
MEKENKNTLRDYLKNVILGVLPDRQLAQDQEIFYQIVDALENEFEPILLSAKTGLLEGLQDSTDYHVKKRIREGLEDVNRALNGGE